MSEIEIRKTVVAKGSVSKCARCGQDHDLIRWYKFERPVEDPDATWTHWGVCPVSGDPILMRSTEAKT